MRQLHPLPFRPCLRHHILPLDVHVLPSDGAVEFLFYALAEFGEQFGEDVGDEDDCGDVPGALIEEREPLGVGVDMDDVAVFFAEGSGAAEGCEREVEEVGYGFGLSGVLVEHSCACEESVRHTDFGGGRRAEELGGFAYRIFSGIYQTAARRAHFESKRPSAWRGLYPQRLVSTPAMIASDKHGVYN